MIHPMTNSAAPSNTSGGLSAWRGLPFHPRCRSVKGFRFCATRHDGYGRGAAVKPHPAIVPPSSATFMIFPIF
jgi:hypothetical protein